MITGCIQSNGGPRFPRIYVPQFSYFQRPLQQLIKQKAVFNATEIPSNFIAGRPQAAFLYWFFGDFRCGVPLFIVILVIYKYKNR